MSRLSFFNCIVLLLIKSNLICSYSNINVPEQRYEPTWESLDGRPLPQWYDDVKIGIFLHWGVFSVPSFHSEWFWANWKNNGQDIVDFMKKNYPPNFSYQDFARDFTAEFFDPDQWAELFKNSGAKYVVLTSKHHEGFTLWPSKYSFSWNSNDTGPHRDLIGELSRAVRKLGLTFGLYHSLYEWFNPLYLQDKNNNFTTKYFVANKILPEMVELINVYKPEVLWSDGDWEARDTYWNSTEFLAWLYNDSPVKDTVVVNDRWGIDIPCKHGDFYTCKDRYNPGVLQPHKWENAMTLDRDSWGYRRNANLNDYFSTFELIKTMTETVSCGGNILINVGPTKEGTITPIFQERLLDLGKWLKINGEAIYQTKPWKYQNDTINNSVWYTNGKNSKNIYAIVLQWPKNNQLEVGAIQTYVNKNADIFLLGYPSKLSWKIRGKSVLITFPDKAVVESDWAWVLKIQLKNSYIN